MVVLPAELTHEQAPACSRMLAEALRRHPEMAVVADAGALERFDSSALAVLLECRREALAQGKRLTVTGMEPRLRALAALYGVAELLPETATGVA